MVSMPSERSGTPASRRTMAPVIARTSARSSVRLVPVVSVAWTSASPMAVAISAAVGRSFSWVSVTGVLRRVRVDAGGLVAADDLVQRGLALPQPLLDRQRNRAVGDLGLDPADLGLNALNVGVGAGDVRAGAVAPVLAGGALRLAAGLAAVGIAERLERIVVAGQQRLRRVEDLQARVVQQGSVLALGGEPARVGCLELAGGGDVAAGGRAADALPVVEPPGSLGQGVGCGQCLLEIQDLQHVHSGPSAVDSPNEARRCPYGMPSAMRPPGWRLMNQATVRRRRRMVTAPAGSSGIVSCRRPCTSARLFAHPAKRAIRSLAMPGVNTSPR